MLLGVELYAVKGQAQLERRIRSDQEWISLCAPVCLWKCPKLQITDWETILLICILASFQRLHSGHMKICNSEGQSGTVTTSYMSHLERHSECVPPTNLSEKRERRNTLAFITTEGKWKGFHPFQLFVCRLHKEIPGCKSSQLSSVTLWFPLGWAKWVE